MNDTLNELEEQLAEAEKSMRTLIAKIRDKFLAVDDQQAGDFEHLSVEEKYTLARHYLLGGDGIERNHYTAKRLLTDCVNDFYTPAMWTLGMAHELPNEGFEYDIVKSIELYKQGARLGDYECASCLYSIYNTGRRGVEKDAKKAEKYWQIFTDIRDKQ